MPKNVVTSPLVFVPAVLALAVSCLACGPARESDPGSASQTADPSSNDSEVSITPSGGSSRDFETFDICSLVPVAEVAEILGHEQATGSANATMGQHASDCSYSFERGDGSSDYAMIWAYPPELWAPEMKDDTEEISGLGAEANSSMTGSFHQVNVLVKGDVYIDTRANTPEQARAMAELALARLVG